MIRPFLNTDVPALIELWKRQPPLVGRLSDLTPGMLEAHVFSKPYFRPDGLLVAEVHDQICAAALCGFGPNPDGGKLDLRVGILSYLWMADPAPATVWPDLFAGIQAYFGKFQTRTICFGSHFPDSPYFAGMYGGTFVPGVLAQDHAQNERLVSVAFRPRAMINVLKLDVRSFKPPIDRRAIMAKRNYEVRLTIDPTPQTWWQHTFYSFRHQYDFRIFERRTRNWSGSVSFCNSRAHEAGWDARIFGISEINVSPQLQRSGLGQAMLLEAVKGLEQHGVIEIEAQVPQSNVACHSLLQKMGFQPWYIAHQMERPMDLP